MHTPTQLVPTGAHSALCGARRRRECTAYRLPQVRELRLRLEPVAPDTFGGLVSSCSARVPNVVWDARSSSTACVVVTSAETPPLKGLQRSG